MENARPSALDGGELTLSWAESAAFYKRKAEDPRCREQIATAIRTVTGSSLRLAYALRRRRRRAASAADARPCRTTSSSSASCESSTPRSFQPKRSP